ncbi:MAG: triose-phosphate isomerase [Halioglobus sp.]
MRKSLVAGNWKMHGSRVSIEQLLPGLMKGLPSPDSSAFPVDVVVCPTYVHLAQALALCEDSPISVGAQDCSHMSSGAYTGEVAAGMLQDLGCEWIILGHSERRQYHGESDDLVAAKLAAVVEAGLGPILCVGETREQREGGNAKTVVAAQLEGALQGQVGLDRLVIAYEPVWAIGTGLTATPEEAQQMHGFIRERLSEVAAVDENKTRILYGGSVKSGNARELFAQSDIDGALVGGAALIVEEFLAIIEAAAI